MPTNFPNSLDVLSNPSPTTELSDVALSHANQHATINDAVEVIEAVIGVTGSTDVNSINYKLNHLPAEGSIQTFHSAWFTTNGTFSWTPPVGVTTVLVTAAAGGGAGGYAAAPGTAVPYAGGGGGSGAACIRKKVTVTPGVAVSLTVGKGGVVGVSAASVTSFGSAISLPGGSVGSNASASSYGPGGSAGSWTDTYTTDGSALAPNVAQAGSYGTMIGGSAGGNGAGGTGGTNSSSGKLGGGGGGANFHDSIQVAPGNGANGFILIEW